jgi:UDP-N-acetylglucosamine--N-acetylmuramyl-(pentapeptide) pyrophosphoryl-undecaprenol N-acetylglucosamine transferase
MEMQRVPEAGYAIEGLKIAGFQRGSGGFVAKLRFPFVTLAAVFKARKIVRKFAPHCAIGTGGYASGPVLWAAQGRGIPTIIQEQNALPGITNKLLSRKANRICLGAAEAAKHLPKTKAIMVTGNPVRAEMRELSLTPSESRVHFGLDPERPTLLIAGGSLGARAINEATLAALPAFAKAGIQLIWHTGANYFADIQAQLAAMPESAKPAMHLASFLTDMPIAYRAASLAVVRAGALTLAELIATRTPAIVAPSPYVAEDHQTHNARALENAGAALVIKDAELTAELAQAVLSLISDPTQLDAMRAGLATLETPNAAERIAAEAIALAQAYAISPMLPLPGPIPFTPKPTPILV